MKWCNTESTPSTGHWIYVYTSRYKIMYILHWTQVSIQLNKVSVIDITFPINLVYTECIRNMCHNLQDGLCGQKQRLHTDMGPTLLPHRPRGHCGYCK